MTVQNREDRECLFCQIVAGMRPAEIVLESTATIPR